MLRCELDAVPVQELPQAEYCSNIDGVAHQCGHDGHMAIIAAVGTDGSQTNLTRPGGPPFPTSGRKWYGCRSSASGSTI